MEAPSSVFSPSSASSASPAPPPSAAFSSSPSPSSFPGSASGSGSGGGHVTGSPPSSPSASAPLDLSQRRKARPVTVGVAQLCGSSSAPSLSAVPRTSRKYVSALASALSLTSTASIFASHGSVRDSSSASSSSDGSRCSTMRCSALRSKPKASLNLTCATRTHASANCLYTMTPVGSITFPRLNSRSRRRRLSSLELSSSSASPTGSITGGESLQAACAARAS